MSIARKYKNDFSCGKRVRYSFGTKHEHKCEKVQFIGGNVFSSNVNELAKEMEIPTQMREAATGKGPGLCGAHYMISLAPGEALSSAQWLEVLHDTMGRLGYTDEHKYYGIVHNDTNKQHMHIVANRISLETYNLLPDGNDYDDLMESARAMEERYGLTKVPKPNETWGVELKEKEITRWARANKNSFDDEGNFKGETELWRNRLVALIATSIEQTNRLKDPNILQFVKLLNKKDVKVDFVYKKSTDDIVGINYTFQGKTISGRKLKRSRLTFQKLTDTKIGGIRYDKKRHLPELQGLVQKKIGRSDAERHEDRLQKRRSGGNLPPGLSYSQSISDLDDGPNSPRLGIRKPQGETNKKESEQLFAIRVEMPRYNWSLANRIMPPTRAKGNYLFYVIKKPGHDVRIEKEVNFIISLMNSMLKTVRSALSILGAKCILEDQSSSSTLDRGPIYEYINPLRTSTNDQQVKKFGVEELGLSNRRTSKHAPP